MDAGGAPALTYAALEARFALERVCYERLRIAHSYISHSDLRTWKPQHVVQTVMEMVDANIASDWTLNIGSEPGDHPPNYIPVGTQKGFDPKYINQLWQAVSSFLHCALPRDTKAPIEHYAAEMKLRSKLEEVLRELDRISEGIMIGALVLEKVSFDCVCGQRNSRSMASLKHNDIINCIKEGCKEQFRAEKVAEEFFFERRKIPVSCYKCGCQHGLPYREVTEMSKATEGWEFNCRGCGLGNVFMWQLRQFTRKEQGMLEPTHKMDEQRRARLS